jgi:starch synthase
MKICLASSELTPFAKTGGLADVSAALARYLDRAGHDLRVFLPLYRRLRASGHELKPLTDLGRLELQLGGRTLSWSLSSLRLPASEVDVWLVDCPELFDQEGIYGGDERDALRFAGFSRMVIEACQRIGWAPDVFHVHDWHTALVPLYLRTVYAWDKLFEKSRSLLTIHNIGYQGIFGSGLLNSIDLEQERRYLWQEDLQEGRFNFLKTGILYANALTTVSNTYAHEIQTAELGMGLDGVLRERADSLVGIVNGIDTEEWDPATDSHLTHHFSSAAPAGKQRCKQDLLQELGLEHDPRVPVFACVSRLTSQKGFELLPDVLPVFLQRQDMRLVLLGSGEERYERYFEWLQSTFPDKVRFTTGYNETLAHRIEAGADLFLMPSRYEPCGLNQLYSLRYGTVPVVRRTGGLADTVKAFDPSTGQGNGFLFDAFESQALYDELQRALGIWPDAEAWKRLVRNAMAEDFSWDHQGPHYVSLYERIQG